MNAPMNMTEIERAAVIVMLFGEDEAAGVLWACINPAQDTPGPATLRTFELATGAPDAGFVGAGGRDRDRAHRIGGDRLVQPIGRFGYFRPAAGACLCHIVMRLGLPIAVDLALAVLGIGLDRQTGIAVHQRIGDQPVPAFVRDRRRAVLLQRPEARY